MPADANFHRTFSSTTDEDNSVVLPNASLSFLNNASAILDDPIFSRDASGLDLVDTIIENATSRAALRLLTLLSDLAIDPPRITATDTSTTNTTPTFRVGTNHRDFISDYSNNHQSDETNDSDRNGPTWFSSSTNLTSTPDLALSNNHTRSYRPSVSNRYLSNQDSEESILPDSNDREVISPDSLRDEQATSIADTSMETFDLFPFMDQQLNWDTSTTTDFLVNDIVNPLSNITDSNTVTSSSPTNHLDALELPSLEEEQQHSIGLESPATLQPSVLEMELTSSSDSSTSNSTAQSSPSIGRTSRLRRHRYTPSRIHTNGGANTTDRQRDASLSRNINPTSWASTIRHMGWMSRPPAWVLLDQLQNESSNSTESLQQNDNNENLEPSSHSIYSTIPDLISRDRNRYRSRTLAATSWMALTNAANVRMRGKPILTNSNKQGNTTKEQNQVIVKVMGQHGVRVGEGRYI